MSDREMDALTFEVKSLQAQRKLSKASIKQAEAAMEQSIANLNYCEIKAPVDGVVIDRKIDPGQTLAAQFQTPELFVVAPDLREKVHVFASVDEADIGLIQAAQKQMLPVTFTVDAHPDMVFEGTIEQLRVSSTATQNVVTYPVVIAAKNPDLKLLPGMTASISFEVDSADDVTKIPNAALRFFPSDIKWVHPDDRRLIDGSTWNTPTEDSEEGEESELSATERAKARKDRNKRHVWVVDGEKLRAVEVETGLSESKYTQLTDGEIAPGDALVTGQKGG
jgi:HlyD family secretion protein